MKTMTNKNYAANAVVAAQIHGIVSTFCVYEFSVNGFSNLFFVFCVSFLTLFATSQIYLQQVKNNEK